MHTRKYVTNVADVVNLYSNNYSQPPPLLGRLLLQFNAVPTKRILVTSATNKVGEPK